MRRIGTPVKKSSLVAGAALAAGLSVVPCAFAAAAQYATWDQGSGLVGVAARNFPVGHLETDSTNPGVASGKSTFLNASTPFGQAFGSSQNKEYELLRLAPGRQPSTTVISFDRPPAGGTWGLALGDVDAENVRVQAFDAAGAQLPAAALGFQGTFNYCTGSPMPSSCLGAAGTDQPAWDPATGRLVGNTTDTNGAAGWFRPTGAVSTLVLTSTLNSGIPAYQVWLAGEDEPSPPAGQPTPPVTPPGTSTEIKVCDGSASNIDLVGAPAGGVVDAHPRQCTVTYTPDKGFSGEDSFTLKLVLPDGRVLVRSFDVKVARTLPDTGAGDLIGLALLAGGLLGAGFVLTIGVQRAGS